MAVYNSYWKEIKSTLFKSLIYNRLSTNQIKCWFLVRGVSAPLAGPAGSSEVSCRWCTLQWELWTCCSALLLSTFFWLHELSLCSHNVNSWCADGTAAAWQVDGRLVELRDFSFLEATSWHLRVVHKLELASSSRLGVNFLSLTHGSKCSWLDLKSWFSDSFNSWTVVSVVHSCKC